MHCTTKSCDVTRFETTTLYDDYNNRRRHHFASVSWYILCTRSCYVCVRIYIEIDNPLENRGKTRSDPAQRNAYLSLFQVYALARLMNTLSFSASVKTFVQQFSNEFFEFNEYFYTSPPTHSL